MTASPSSFSGVVPSPGAPVSFTHALSVKQDDKNFLLWTQQVEAVIIAHKLHRFVVNPHIPQKYATETDDVLDLPTDEYESWLVQDQMLFTWLLSSLSDSILPRVLGCKHSYQVWDKIHKHFYSQMKATARQLRCELKNTKKGTKTINEYVLRVKNIVDSLIVVGDSVTEQDQTDAILGGLPEEYNAFIMMMYGRLEPVSITDLESLLMVQEAQLEKFKSDAIAGTISVNVAQGLAKSETQTSDDHYNRGGGRAGRNRGGRANRDGRGRGRGPRPTSST